MMGGWVEILFPISEIDDPQTRAWFVDGGANQSWTNIFGSGGSFAPGARPHQIGTDALSPVKPVSITDGNTVVDTPSSTIAELAAVFLAGAVLLPAGGGNTFVGSTAVSGFLRSHGYSSVPATPVDTFLMAGWIGYADTSTGHNLVLLFDNGSSGNFFNITVLDDGTAIWYLTAFDQYGLAIFDCHVTIPVDLKSGWHSFAISGRMSTATVQIMVDRVLYDDGTGSTFTWYNFVCEPTHPDNPIPWSPITSGTLEFGGAPAGGLNAPPEAPPYFTYGPTPGGPTLTPYSPGMAFSSLRFGVGEPFFDLTDSTNVDKLFAPGNHPVSWGIQGELVTGEIPAVYLYGTADIYDMNFGLGWSPIPNTDDQNGVLADFTPGPI